MAADDDKAKSLGPNDMVEYDQELEQEVEEEEPAGSSSGSWESGNEDERFDNRREGAVMMARETGADVTVNRLSVVPAVSRRQQQQQSTKMPSLRG